MTDAAPSLGGASFSKSRRLLHRRDYQFVAAAKVRSSDFLFVLGKAGRGRLGLSISRRVIPLAVGRNRVRRLLRESFRHQQTQFAGVDVNVVALASLSGRWEKLAQSDVDRAILAAAKMAKTLSAAEST